MLLQCAAACDRALSRYVDSVGLNADTELVRTLIYAMAAVTTAANYDRGEPAARRLALQLTVDVCQPAAAICREHGLDRDLLLCAAACERAAAEAELALTAAA